jgi:thiol-disulfide isomerase/thioredoxin
VNGNEVSFSDFKGKVVYVDVWATWCAPCRDEIPHLKELEEHFEGNKDIVLISISIDTDAQRWKNFVLKEKLGGVQLFDYAKSSGSIVRLYPHFLGIPNFMLFDKEGKIVSIDAPRPSSPELIPLLNEILETN